jgi:hypothetical protein
MHERRLHNGLSKPFVVPRFRRLFGPSIQSEEPLLILNPHRTLRFDSISGFHMTHKANCYMNCETLGWFYTKGLSLSSNEWVVVGTS